MAGGVKIGTFTGQAGTGNQAITGVGFQPSAILIFHSVVSEQVAATASMRLGIGTGSTARFCGGFVSDDNAAAATTRRTFHSDAIIHVLNDTATTTFSRADLVSLDADGFTLNWSTANSTITYTYIAFENSISAKAGTFDLNSATGNQSVSGVGFQPKFVLFFNTLPDITEGVQTATAAWNVGAAVSSTSRWAHASVDTSAANPTDTARYLTNTKCLARISSSAVTAEADFVSMDANGFTINVTTGLASRWGYLALGGSGLSATLGTLTAPATAPQDQSVSGLAFNPNLVLIGGLASSLGTIATDLMVPFGASDYVLRQAAMAAFSSDNQATTVTSRTYRYSSIKPIVDRPNSDGSATTERAILKSMDPGGFTLHWPISDGSAQVHGYIALSVAASSLAAATKIVGNVVLGPGNDREAVTKIVGNVVLGPGNDRASVTKIVGSVVLQGYASLSVTTAAPSGSLTIPPPVMSYGNNAQPQMILFT